MRSSRLAVVYKRNRYRRRNNENKMNNTESEIVVVPSSSEEPGKEEEEEEEEEEETKSVSNHNSSLNGSSKGKGTCREEEDDDEVHDDEGEDEEGEEGVENGDMERRKSVSRSHGCRFPMHRVKRIIRSEGDDFRPTHQAVFLINKAAELFIDLLVEDAYGCSVEDRKKAVYYKYLSSIVCKRKRYDFLSDFVPEKIRAEDALAERKLAGP